MIPPARIQLQDCWAKTDDQGRPSLPVRDHCLNVGAVCSSARALLPSSNRHLLPEGGITLIASHDIGKITPGFLMKCPAWRAQWQAVLNLDSPDLYEGSHTKAGQKYLSECPEFSGRPPRWMISVGGHHGKYVTTSARVHDLFDGDFLWCKALKDQLLEEIRNVFGPLPTGEIEKSARLHWFTGFMVFCDWIGSNTGWFSAVCQESATTLEEATLRAQSALHDIGWHLNEPASGVTFSQMFDSSAEHPFLMRPLQSALVGAVDGPGLYIIEAPMGEGKTEAALAAAYRRWTDGGERGLYFALPTQLTSNRIHERVEAFLSKVLASPSSLSLVHGNAWISGNRITPISPTAGGEEGASAANLWFSDSRKALLAPFGVGTMDQALMSVIPVKHSALRLFALSGKVVVIDEVHSYDPYTSALVDRAVGWLIKVGCTVIVLSATLTKDRRAALVAAAGAVEETISESYPLITKVGTGALHAETIAVPRDAAVRKEVQISNLSRNGSEWAAAAVAAAESGACVLIVRNTIALAQQTYDQMKSACRDCGVEFGLLHSRFPQFRRDENESLWMGLLGKREELRPHHGCILVGTQVVEQSVDIDADLLISDLAPTDMLLQRIGRLHRHARRRPRGYTSPQCIILQPSVNWGGEVAEIKKSLGPSAYVYPPFALFQAQRVWERLTQIVLPEEIRPLLEESSRTPDDLPAGAAALREELEQLVSKMLGTAWMNTVFGTASVDDVEGTQTRWKSPPSAFVVLIKTAALQCGRGITLNFLDGSEHVFEPGGFDFELARKLRQNGCRVPRYLVADMLPSTPTWLAQHFPDSILAVCPVDSTQCLPCHSPESTAYRLIYHMECGLSHERNASAPAHLDDESWF